MIPGFSLFLGILFNYLFFDKIPGLSFLIFNLFVVGGLFLIVKFFGRSLSREALWLMAPLFFFSAMLSVRASPELMLLNIAASLGLLLLIAEVSFGDRLRSFFMLDYLKIVLLPFKFLAPLWKTLSKLAAPRPRKEKTVSHVLKGILIAAPFLFVFLLLFSSADLVFEKYISNLVSIEINGEIVVRTILILAVFLAFTGAYSYILGEREKKKSAEAKEGENVRPGGPLGRIESYILFGSVDVLFLIFIIIQVAYFFGGESNIISAGFTYAEYARRGFFELIVVALISLFLLLAADQLVYKENGGHAVEFKFLCAALIAEVLVIMFSAYARLSLYEEAYGFTVQRLFSHSFIILLGIIFCLLAWKTLRNGRENYFALGVFVTFNLFVFGMNMMDPDSFIARRNLERFETTGKIDVRYLSGLSDDAMPELVGALNTNDREFRNYLGKELYQRGGSESFAKWQSWNIARRRAVKMLLPKMGELEQFKDYQPKEKSAPAEL
ncbi:DUF4173 domain-containing protein [Candidatus Giovannonibacteria bacterium]|nr:DUF4173 domain-containing protein [Candidatus Giovannonibacteria bacterium]